MFAYVHKWLEVQMSVRKRSWTTDRGEPREAWVVDYTDQLGRRCHKTFRRKKDADAYHSQVAVDVRAGIHTAESRSITVAEAGDLWLKSREMAGVERTSLANYQQHLRLHIAPLIGLTKLSAMTVPFVHAFEDRLRQDRSAHLVRTVMVSLSCILAEAQSRGLVAQNVAHSRRRSSLNGRHRKRLEVGRDIPRPDEIRAISGALTSLANPRWRPLILTAIFTGLRASEIRGLRWVDVDLDRAAIHVRQRADAFGTIGKPKSRDGTRTVPLPPLVTNTLREWKLRSEGGELVFPSRDGRPLHYKIVVGEGWHRAQIAAGVVDTAGKPKYPGLHALRHFYASWCINRKADGGLELPIKVVQARLGHASIQMTADTYGHLFPRGDDGAELAAAERALMAVPTRG
jgi:integrase